MIALLSMCFVAKGVGAVLNEEKGATVEVGIEVNPEILVNEVNFKNPKSDWIELFVVDDGSDGEGVNLKGYYLKDDGFIKKIEENFWVNNGDYVLVKFGEGDDEFPYLYSGKKGLVATTEQVVLYGTNDEILDVFCWVNDRPAKSELKDFEQIMYSEEWLGGEIESCFDSGAVGKNESVGRVGFEDSNSVDDWEVMDGTPLVGNVLEVEKNEVEVEVLGDLDGDVVISEIFPNPVGKDKGNEWVEIYNEGEEDVNLEGWAIDDEEEGGKPYFLSGVIGAGEVLIFEDVETGVQLGNSGGEVRLLGAGGGLVDSVSYEGAKEGMSYARMYGEADGEWEWTGDASKGEKNKSVEVVEGVVVNGPTEERVYGFEVDVEGEIIVVNFRESSVSAGLGKVVFGKGAELKMTLSEGKGGYWLEGFEVLGEAEAASGEGLDWYYNLVGGGGVLVVCLWFFRRKIKEEVFDRLFR